MEKLVLSEGREPPPPGDEVPGWVEKSIPQGLKPRVGVVALDAGDESPAYLF
jgi:hypothetical protein